MFNIDVRAKVGSRVLVRETIKQYRKDVTAKCVRNLSFYIHRQRLNAIDLSSILSSSTLSLFNLNPLHLFQYGGDVTRKMKLLKQQAIGKKKMKEVGNVNVPKDAFISVLKRT